MARVATPAASPPPPMGTIHGEVFDDAAELAAQLSREEGLTYVHPFNDLTLATGQGTIAYEIFQDLPDGRGCRRRR